MVFDSKCTIYLLFLGSHYEYQRTSLMTDSVKLRWVIDYWSMFIISKKRIWEFYDAHGEGGELHGTCW